MKRLMYVIVLVLLLVGVSATGSLAGVKKIMPYELRPYESDCVYVMTPTFMSSYPETLVDFYAVVKLPVGKVVKKLTFYYLLTNKILTFCICVILLVLKFGSAQPEWDADNPHISATFRSHIPEK